jgi:hypothetical protein
MRAAAKRIIADEKNCTSAKSTQNSFTIAPSNSLTRRVDNESPKGYVFVQIGHTVGYMTSSTSRKQRPADAVPVCKVLSCGDTARHSWASSTAWRGWPVEWLVCPAHFTKLLADHDWELVHGQPPSWRPWILMGDDVGRRSEDVDDQRQTSGSLSGGPR